MSAPSAVEAARVYVEAGAADAFARRLLVAHGVPEHDAATVAACLGGALSDGGAVLGDLGSLIPKARPPAVGQCADAL